MVIDTEKLKKELEEAGQGQLLGTVDAAEKLAGIDLELVSGLYRLAREGARPDEGNITPIPVTVAEELPKGVRAKYVAEGERLIREGAFASVTMAGGQGTRLGHTGPKGTFDLGVREHSLFEIQASRLLRRAASSGGGRQIPWYIMTSEENDGATRRFFEDNAYFGYDRDNVFFFTQFMLPMLDFEGRIVRDRPDSIKMGADGHGGIFRAMDRRGVIRDMEKRGIRYAFVGGIDNVLVKLCDPLFIGFASLNGYPCAGKSLIKRDPYEKAGVFCLRDGRPYVVEYTEISDEMARATDARGDFIYGDAHILCNIFSVDALKDAGAEGLPYHVAVKKTQFVNGAGEVVVPDKPNAYKFEAFIFDAFCRYPEMGILRVRREDEFAPLKNKTGEDSVETARALYESALERNMLD
jgi:UDP-N-acetylglucosamine pyrophosphorylase